MIVNSLRAQLTIWYTAVLALVLIIFAIVTYQYLARTAQQRTDRSLAESGNSFLTSLVMEASDENQSVEAAAVETAEAFHFPDRQIIVLDRQRKVMAASTAPGDFPYQDLLFSPNGNAAVVLDNLYADASSAPTYTTLKDGRGSVRIYALPAQTHGITVMVVTAQSLKEQIAALAQARRAFFLAVPIALLFASLGGYFLARKSLAPVLAMSNQAARISATNLGQRLPVPRARNELTRLAEVFNDLLTRLGHSFEQQRRFMADASHELRTPVAIIRGESEVVLSRDVRSSEDYRESLTIVHDEGKRLARIVEDLFTLARADNGQYPLERSNMYLEETVGQCVRSVDSLATQRGLRLHFETSAHELFFSGDEGLVRRMTLNILDNAIKYTPSGGSVRVRLDRNSQACNLTISDTGLGIPTELQAKIFERFFRADQSRSRNGERDGSGAGLGLSIARWIAEMHGGSLVLATSDQNGSTFVISLPLSQA
jgi:two-component system OmpR family sensor kinase